MSDTEVSTKLTPNAQDRRHYANAIRALSMDAVQKANCGHPGAPMGMADIAEVLWNDFLSHNPSNPDWDNRDRFVLSNGHGSMLIYSLLHLSGYDLTVDDLKQFRQLHSKTPGHPEYGYTPGVETTTGPLGQGLTNAVGFAIAERTLASQFNKDAFNIVDHYTYAFVGDGCLMEGISHEACSLAGTLGLGKLIVFYDDNGISIDGEVDGWFADDTVKRFESYGWQVIPQVDGHDSGAVKSAIERARSDQDKPTLICCKTIIGWGSPNKQGKESCHGAALGEEEVALVRKTIGWEHEAFHVPDDVYAAWSGVAKGKHAEAQWQSGFDEYAAQYPGLAKEYQRRLAGEFPSDFKERVNAYINETRDAAEKIASRKASQNALHALGPLLPELIGGSADLAGSNLTMWSGSVPLSQGDFSGNYIYYGVREFAMAAIMNGLSLHGGFIPYGGTFLIFSEYARNALRMAALMKVQSIFVFTHDSIGLGEDGPTHQAVEQTATLRLVPNMSVWRPCDATETAVAWKMAVKNQDGPTSLALSRQGLPAQTRTVEQLANIEKGAYVLLDCEGEAEMIVIATGSEVEISRQAVEQLQAKGVKLRLVSMPSADAFDRQDEAYKASVLPDNIRKRVAVEAGVSDYWRKYVGLDGAVIGVDRFGESAPADQVYQYLGVTVEKIIEALEALG